MVRRAVAPKSGSLVISTTTTPHGAVWVRTRSAKEKFIRGILVRELFFLLQHFCTRSIRHFSAKMPQPSVTATGRARPYVVDIERGIILEKNRSFIRRAITVAKYLSGLLAFAVVLECLLLHLEDLKTMTSMSQRIEAIESSPSLPALARSAPVEHNDIPDISAYIEENNNNVTGLLEAREDCNPLSPLCRRGHDPAPDILKDEHCTYFDRWKQYLGMNDDPCDDPICGTMDNLMKKLGIDPPCIAEQNYKKRSAEPVNTHEPWVDDQWLERYKIYRQQQAGELFR